MKKQKLTTTIGRENHMKAFEHSCMELGGVNLKQTLSAVSVLQYKAES